MATAPRKSTAQSRTRRTGAAPAVAKDADLTIESETPLVVDSTTDGTDSVAGAMERAEAEADAEDARQEIADRAAATAAQEVAAPTAAPVEPVVNTVPADEPPKITQGLYGPAGTREEPVLSRDAADAQAVPVAEPESPKRDLAALRALTDTSGADPVTPYPSPTSIPVPTPDIPAARDNLDWTRETDTPAKARVLVDGFRVKVNNTYRFALKGDIITAPSDIIAANVKRGVLHAEG